MKEGELIHYYLFYMEECCCCYGTPTEYSGAKNIHGGGGVVNTGTSKREKQSLQLNAECRYFVLKDVPFMFLLRQAFRQSSVVGFEKALRIETMYGLRTTGYYQNFPN